MRAGRMLVKGFLLALALAGTALAGTALAQEARLRVLDEPLGEVAPLAITGFNYGLSMQLALYSEEFSTLNLRALRFPPGNDADDYPLSRDMMVVLKGEWQRAGEPELLVVVNFFEGPEHALEVARTLRELELPVRFWAVGNEPDLYPRNRMDPSWTPEVYCERFRAFAEALRGFDPGAVISGPAVSGSRPLAMDFLQTFLRLCGDVVDVLTWHVYPTDGTWEDEAALLTSSTVGEEIRRIKGWLESPEHNPLGYERDIGLGITEFGLSWRTPNLRHLEDMVAAIWLADALGQMATAGLDWGFYFALQAMGGHGLIDRGGWVRPTYYVFELLADFRGEVREAELRGAPPLLSAYAVENARGLQVLLVNRGAEDARVALELAGGLEVKTLDEASFDDTLSYRVGAQGADETLWVPARSVVLVRGAR